MVTPLDVACLLMFVTVLAQMETSGSSQCTITLIEHPCRLRLQWLMLCMFVCYVLPCLFCVSGGIFLRAGGLCEHCIICWLHACQSTCYVLLSGHDALQNRGSMDVTVSGLILTVGFCGFGSISLTSVGTCVACSWLCGCWLTDYCVIRERLVAICEGGCSL